MLYDLLDVGPLVLCLDVNTDYTETREALQPYRRKNMSWLSVTDVFSWRMGHCVTAYGYRCPDSECEMFVENEILRSN